VSAFRRPWANPLVQFVLAALILFGLTWWATGLLSERAGKTEAVADARVTTELLGRGVAQPAIPRGMVKGDVGAIERLQELIREEPSTTCRPGHVQACVVQSGDLRRGLSGFRER